MCLHILHHPFSFLLASKFTFRKTAGDTAIADGVARIESIKGNSVVWNQTFGYGAKGAGVWDGNILTINGTHASALTTYDTKNTYGAKFVPIVPSHKYYIGIEIMSGTITGDVTYVINPAKPYTKITLNSSTKSFNGIISQLDETVEYWFIRTYSTGSEFTNVKVRHVVRDLTKMFGSGNEPTTLEEYYQRKPLGVDDNAYNEGEVIHVDVQSIESQGVNAWDEEWVLGTIANATGENIADSSRIRSKNFIPIFPSTDYYCYYGEDAGSNHIYSYFYDKDKNLISAGSRISGKVFTTPSNAHYLRISNYGATMTTYKGDICINISDSSINGKYFPYIKRVEDLSIIRKYFPDGMKSAGSAHDEIRYNKTTQKWEKVVRIGEVDMGVMNWVYDGSGYFMFELPKLIKDIKYGNNIMTIYTTHKSEKTQAALPDKSILLYNGAAYPLLGVRDSAYTDAASFKAAMAGVMLYYELAEPIITELDEEDQNLRLDYDVWRGGTERANTDSKSAAFSADILYPDPNM